jgi:hypothetical protein
MYVKGLPATGAGVALLPFIDNNTTLFVLAASLIVAGVATFAVATIAGRKNRATN